jgi:hypothetical protein
MIRLSPDAAPKLMGMPLRAGSAFRGQRTQGKMLEPERSGRHCRCGQIIPVIEAIAAGLPPRSKRSDVRCGLR